MSIISSSGSPRCLFISPTGNVGIVPFSAGRAVAAERNDVGLIAMVAWIFVEIRMAPRIERDVLRQIRPGPLRRVLGPHAERVQTHFGGRISSGVELVCAERGHER